MIERVKPMLAVAGEPFDSEDHLYEVKWDGVRALASVEAGRWQLWGRELADYGPRYPELEVIRRLPPQTVVDGELVVLREGRATLEAILRRHQLLSPRKIQSASRQSPVTYVLFDLPYCQGRPLVDQPLRQRRARLEELLEQAGEPRLLLSPGIVGPGREFFNQVVAQGHEGVMAKHLTSRYVPGRRVAAWRKIKPKQCIPCAIIGYRPSREGVRSLLVSASWQGSLQYAAELTAGLSAEAQAQLRPLLVQRIRPKPVVACPKQATWVQPDLFCRVRFLQRTPRGRLRGASFQGLLGKSP